MKRTLIVLSTLALGATAVLAESDAIAKRQALMKANGKATGPVVAIMKGGPFDLAAVQAALKTYADAAEKGPALFPDDSKTGGDTEALPAIWENKKDFEARFAKLGTDANAALSTIKDEATFKEIMPNVLKNCGGCHETYREKKKS
jgi:cytochrome c556